MKGRKSKRKQEPDVQPLDQNTGPAAQIAVEPEPQSPADAVNSAQSEPEVQTFEISGELQQEIENFTNSFHVERHPGTPPASVEAPATIEPPRATSGSKATPPAAADRRANPRYAFHATAEVTATDSSAKTKTRVRDLSQQGCYLDTDAPLLLGTPANVRMSKGAKSLEVEGRVVYVQPGKGMGLMFTGVKPE